MSYPGAVETDSLVKFFASYLERLPIMTPRERELFADALDLLIHPPTYEVNGSDIRLMDVRPAPQP